ncbi:hypothetical protein J2S70_000321 [Trueperella bonasi]|uniref:Uncharacterized protein n=2 Tax=Trueperella bonasi TaxID=312286 RepID=A0ABT9NEH0_9ACTO|nr:hypothetical protein [Trueperella bonasi]
MTRMPCGAVTPMVIHRETGVQLSGSVEAFDWIRKFAPIELCRVSGRDCQSSHAVERTAVRM